jgi:hypothetical protein
MTRTLENKEQPSRHYICVHLFNHFLPILFRTHPMLFVRLLERKEKFEQYLVERCIHILDQLPQGKLVSLIFCGLTVLFLIMGVSVLFFSPLAAPKSALYSLVEPGKYRPRQCSQWKFEDGTDAHLEHAVAAMSKTVELHNVNILTSNQMGVPFCVIEFREDGPTGQHITMLNPKLVSRHGSTTEYTIKLNSLCGPQNSSRYTAKLSQEVGVSWESPSKSLGRHRYTGQMAYEMQVALLVLNGEDICQSLPNTIKP